MYFDVFYEKLFKIIFPINVFFIKKYFSFHIRAQSFYFFSRHIYLKNKLKFKIKEKKLGLENLQIHENQYIKLLRTKFLINKKLILCPLIIGESFCQQRKIDCFNIFQFQKYKFLSLYVFYLEPVIKTLYLYIIDRKLVVSQRLGIQHKVTIKMF